MEDKKKSFQNKITRYNLEYLAYLKKNEEKFQRMNKILSKLKYIYIYCKHDYNLLLCTTIINSFFFVCFEKQKKCRKNKGTIIIL